MSDFSRRHYETIAAALAAERANAFSIIPITPANEAETNARCDALANLATSLANTFERDNPNFNRIRFFLAADCEDQKP